MSLTKLHFRRASKMQTPHILLFAAYTVILVTMTGVKPFWLDEVLQLAGTSKTSSVSALWNFVQNSAGAAPLGYFIQHWAIRIAGLSYLSARGLSELFSLTSCIGLLLLIRLLKTGSETLAIFIWMIVPLQLRYALEARPYSLALCLCVFGTIFFFRLACNPSATNAARFIIMAVAGLYSAPYSFFIYIGYGLALFLEKPLGKAAMYSALSMAASIVSFLPWYFVSAEHWMQAVPSSNEAAFTLHPKLALMILREISGGGYFSSLAILLLAGAGLVSSHISRFQKHALVMGVVTGMSFALLFDQWFKYFFAVRQVMFTLIPLMVLAAAGITYLFNRKTLLVTGIACILVGGCLLKDYSYFSDRRENWSLGAAALEAEVIRGACVSATGGDLAIYGFFQPTVHSHVCLLSNTPVVVALAFNSYSDKRELGVLVEGLRHNGYIQNRNVRAGGTDLRIYTRRTSGEEKQEAHHFPGQPAQPDK